MTERLVIWGYVLVAVAVAVLGNYIGATWASKPDKLSLWLLAILVVSPFVFITFGLVTNKLGVAIGSGTLDALLTVSTIVLGLVVFGESSKLSMFQYLGLGFVVAGIILLQFSLKTEV